MPPPFAKPEVMSPAGHWPQLRAAIEAGADAVYFGLKHFTARAKVGFALDELPEVIRTVHGRGVKGYVTFNTLVFDHELGEAARALAAIARAGADAVIVQDLGIVQLARRVSPSLEIHGSTQMSITSAEGVRLAQRFGIKRVTLARELSLDEVRAIRAQTDCELEIFVHGALCVAYSGQCFSSEAWGGRSANRGQCAQACRLPYDLIVDDHRKPLGDSRYLLSPGDLMTLRHIPEIVRVGVSALKIEGRYKDAEYVALTTRAYRDAVDRAWSGSPACVAQMEELQLEQIYSRGLGPYFLSGTNHQQVVRGRAPRHRGVLIGRVIRIADESVLIQPASAAAVSPVKPGDGLVFDAADWRSPEEPEEGGRVYEAAAAPDGAVELRFANRAIDLTRIRPGDLVWRTHDPAVQKAARPYIDTPAPVRRQPVRVRVIAREGEPMAATWTLVDRPSMTVSVNSPEPLAAARARSITLESLREQFGRLGGTAYELTSVDLEMHGRPFAPPSLLNSVRRQAVELLRRLQTDPKVIEVCDAATELADVRPVEAARSGEEGGSPRIHLLVRTPAQLNAAIDLRPSSITLDYLDLYGLKPSVERVKSAGLDVRVAAPRVLKPGEQRIVEFLLRLESPVLVRSTGLITMLGDRRKPRLTGDFSLNAANRLTAVLLLSLGLDRITPTHDLNAAQITDLASFIGGSRLEVVAYQHLPVFHTEHCVFCRFMSAGASFKDCGRPCESHRVALRDAAGRSHPLLADVGCRNTVFGAEAQEAGLYLESWMRAGIRDFRLEFVHESPAVVDRITRLFEQALAGAITGRQLSRSLNEAAPGGATQGSLFVPRDYLTLPVLQ
jgi:putative protease